MLVFWLSSNCVECPLVATPKLTYSKVVNLLTIQKAYPFSKVFGKAGAVGKSEIVRLQRTNLKLKRPVKVVCVYEWPGFSDNSYITA